jgi:hypothetical protein
MCLARNVLATLAILLVGWATDLLTGPLFGLASLFTCLPFPNLPNIFPQLYLFFAFLVRNSYSAGQPFSSWPVSFLLLPMNASSKNQLLFPWHTRPVSESPRSLLLKPRAHTQSSQPSDVPGRADRWAIFALQHRSWLYHRSSRRDETG